MIEIIGYFLIAISLVDILGTSIVIAQAVNKYGLKEVLSYKTRLIEICHELGGDILVLIFALAKLKG
jgi:hypothetical protein